MAVSDRRFAAQIVAPGEEALFFDDLGCLRDYLSASGNTVSDGAVVFVADHRTAEWVDARQALFTRRESVATPMASGLMAHRDTSSLKEDREAQGAVAVAPGEILFGRGTGGGR